MGLDNALIVAAAAAGDAVALAVPLLQLVLGCSAHEPLPPSAHASRACGSLFLWPKAFGETMCKVCGVSKPCACPALLAFECLNSLFCRGLRGLPTG